MEPPLPRIPRALATYYESLPIGPRHFKRAPTEVGVTVISLQAMCCKYWLETVQYTVRRDLPKPKIMALQRYLQVLPHSLRLRMIHNALKAGGLHLAHGSRELTAVNKALIFLTSDICVQETVYISVPKPGIDGVDWPPDLELLLRNGEGITKLALSLPSPISDTIKRVLSHLFRTCQKISHLTVYQATDDVMAVITRHLPCLNYLDVSRSTGVTDDGASRMVINFRWSDNELPTIQHIDVGSTSVTSDGIINILSRIPSLVSMGSTDVIECLEAAHEISGDPNVGLALREITVRCATVSRLQFLRRFCPNLISITTTLQENPGATLNDLRLLPNIRHLGLTVREPFLLAPGHMYNFVWDIGINLLTLRVSGDIYWEADLGLIAAHCPNLEELAIPAVTFPNKDSLKALLAEGTLTFSKLKILELDCLTGVGQKAWAKDFDLIRSGLVAALKLCIRIRKLIFRPTNLVESNLMEILSTNRMLYLEVLELYNCALGLSAARLLLDCCTNLHVMKGLKTWRGLSLQDLVQLRKYSRGHRRAAELKILP